MLFSWFGGEEENGSRDCRLGRKSSSNSGPLVCSFYVSSMWCASVFGFGAEILSFDPSADWSPLLSPLCSSSYPPFLPISPSSESILSPHVKESSLHYMRTEHNRTQLNIRCPSFSLLLPSDSSDSFSFFFSTLLFPPPHIILISLSLEEQTHCTALACNSLKSSSHTHTRPLLCRL